jgi:hypothetical protein
VLLQHFLLLLRSKAVLVRLRRYGRNLTDADSAVFSVSHRERLKKEHFPLQIAARLR